MTATVGEIHAAAQEAVTVAASCYKAARTALARILTTARAHDVDLDELVALTGLGHAEVAELLKEAGA